jgi:argininosuccinate lyase
VRQIWGAIIAASAILTHGGALAEGRHDDFFWIGEMNKASAVMLVSTGIVDRPLGRKILLAVTQVIANGDQPGAARPADYLQIEPLLVKAGGPDVTRLHSGRSRQDMLSTSQRLALRDQFLDNFDSLNAYRAALLRLARSAPDAIVPAYTMDQQAQPISFGHFISGFLGAFERQADRMRESYARLNLSPLGAAAVGTSSFPIDRRQLAALLGFDGVVENSFDANHVSPFDLDVEMASLSSSSAVTTGALLADFLDQYRASRPWLILAAADTAPSSIMPQKRNPLPLLTARQQASRTLGQAETAMLTAHNVDPGVIEYRADDTERALADATDLQANMARLLDELHLDPAQALTLVKDDFATTTELADILQREANVPFRVGHQFASRLVDYGRGADLRPSELPFEVACRLYAQTAKDMLGQDDAVFPLTEARFRQALTPENMVRSSRGLGGPQPSEVARILAAQAARLTADQTWVSGRREALATASRGLDKSFAALATPETSVGDR